MGYSFDYPFSSRRRVLRKGNSPQISGFDATMELAAEVGGELVAMLDFGFGQRPFGIRIKYEEIRVCSHSNGSFARFEAKKASSSERAPFGNPTERQPAVPHPAP